MRWTSERLGGEASDPDAPTRRRRRRRPAAAGLHLLPPEPRARDPGRPRPAHPVRADHRRDRPGPARAARRRWPSGSPGPGRRSRRPASPTGCRPTTSCPTAGRRCSRTTYLLFNEGYAATVGRRPGARRPGRRGDPAGPPAAPAAARRAGALGLLALMLLQDSRAATRLDADRGGGAAGRPGPCRWDRAAIGRPSRSSARRCAAPPDRPDRYVVQAAIAACHALAPTLGRDRLEAVVSWYDVLLTPRRRPGRAAQPGGRDRRARRGRGRARARRRHRRARVTTPLWHASRAVLLRRLGREHRGGRRRPARAAALPLNDPQRRFLGTERRPLAQVRNRSTYGANRARRSASSSPNISAARRDPAEPAALVAGEVVGHRGRRLGGHRLPRQLVDPLGGGEVVGHEVVEADVDRAVRRHHVAVAHDRVEHPPSRSTQ